MFNLRVFWICIFIISAKLLLLGWTWSLPCVWASQPLISVELKMLIMKKLGSDFPERKQKHGVISRYKFASLLKAFSNIYAIIIIVFISMNKIDDTIIIANFTMQYKAVFDGYVNFELLMTDTSEVFKINSFEHFPLVHSYFPKIHYHDIPNKEYLFSVALADLWLLFF